MGRARRWGRWFERLSDRAGNAHASHRVDWMMHVMKTNYGGVVNVTNSVLPYMRERKAGTVVIIGSRWAYRNEFMVSIPDLYLIFP